MIFCCDGGSMLNSEGESYSADILFKFKFCFLKSGFDCVHAVRTLVTSIVL